MSSGLLTKLLLNHKYVLPWLGPNYWCPDPAPPAAPCWLPPVFSSSIIPSSYQQLAKVNGLIGGGSQWLLTYRA